MQSELITKYYSAISRRDMGSIRSCFCDDATLVFGDIELTGIEAIMNGYHEFLSSMSDYSPSIARQWVCEDTTVVIEGTATGKNATDTVPFTVPFAAVFQLRGGRVLSQRDYFDPGKMMPNG